MEQITQSQESLYNLLSSHLLRMVDVGKVKGYESDEYKTMNDTYVLLAQAYNVLAKREIFS